MKEKLATIFSTRDRIKRVKFWGGIFHLLSVALCLLGALSLYPHGAFQKNFELQEKSANLIRSRQQLMEAMDKLVRYEDYYRELHGRYTRDLSRLFLPEKLSTGSWEDVRRHYEISALDVQGNHLLMLAQGVDRPDRATIDERHRFSVNFAVPTPSKSYLYEEADRAIRLSKKGKLDNASLAAGFWTITKEKEDSGDHYYATGVRGIVVGERHEERGYNSREIASIFTAVSEQVKNHMAATEEKVPAAAGSVFDASDVGDYLRSARDAEHIFKRERGHYARKWEELDSVTGFHFQERQQRAENIRVHPIDVKQDDSDFHLVIEGTSGELLGEKFMMEEAGEIREMRYTDALINQLQESTQLLESASKFQISEEPSDTPQAILDRKKSDTVHSIDQVK